MNEQRNKMSVEEEIVEEKNMDEIVTLGEIRIPEGAKIRIVEIRVEGASPMNDEERSLEAIAIAEEMETIGLKCVIRDGNGASLVWE